MINDKGDDMTLLQLPRSTPEAQGVSSEGIGKFVREVDRKIDEMHSFMLLRHGAVIAEGWWKPYSAERVHMLFSLTKSFTSSAVGLAAAEGRLSVDDKVLGFFPDETPAKPSENLKAMRVRHLLSMVTGHAEDTTGRMAKRGGKDWVKGFLALEVENEPGAPFVYNSGASYMLSAIVQKVTGMKLEEYLKPRLFEPLGIEKWDWETCPKGINIGGWGLAVTTEAIARFGQLYLQKGEWDGKRILPEAWVEAATSKQVPNDSEKNIDWQQGYGYQFWRCRHGAYRGDGAFGQYCIVMPEQQAVLAITSAVDDMQAVLNKVWEHLLPAFREARLAANPAAKKELSKTIASLAHKPPTGTSQLALASQVRGKTYTIEPNAQKVKWLRFDFDGNGCLFTFKAGRRIYRLPLREGAWSEGMAPGFGYPAVPVVVSGAWNGEDAYQMVLRYIETPVIHTMTCRFSKGKVTVDGVMNVAFGPKELPQLVGKMR
jgi:CubicO group peptidase (beta-lactamase class C family)